MGEIDNGVVNRLRTRIGRDLLIESLCSGLIGTLIEMPVDVQNRPNRGMAKTIGNDLGMLSLGDEQCYLGVAKRVGSEIFVQSCSNETRFPKSPHPTGAANRFTLGGGKDPILRRS